MSPGLPMQFSQKAHYTLLTASMIRKAASIGVMEQQGSQVTKSPFVGNASP